jgi:hypothetical protein
LTSAPHKNPVVRKSKVGGIWPIKGCHAKDVDGDDDDAYFDTH